MKGGHHIVISENERHVGAHKRGLAGEKKITMPFSWWSLTQPSWYLVCKALLASWFEVLCLDDCMVLLRWKPKAVCFQRKAYAYSKLHSVN